MKINRGVSKIIKGKSFENCDRKIDEYVEFNFNKTQVVMKTEIRNA
jgi:hypothetical protein